MIPDSRLTVTYHLSISLYLEVCFKTIVNKLRGREVNGNVFGNCDRKWKSSRWKSKKGDPLTLSFSLWSSVHSASILLRCFSFFVLYLVWSWLLMNLYPYHFIQIFLEKEENGAFWSPKTSSGDHETCMDKKHAKGRGLRRTIMWNWEGNLAGSHP